MNIADGMRNITENIVACHNVRVKALGDLVEEVSETIRRNAADRKAMSKEQAAELARFASDLAGRVKKELEVMAKNRALSAKELKGRLQKEAEDLKKLVKKMLADYSKDRAEMSEALRHNLQGFVKDIIKSVDDLHLGKVVADLRNETRGTLSDYRADMRKARDIWSNMTRILSEAGSEQEELPVVEGEEKVGTVAKMVHRIHRRKKGKK